MNRLLSSLLLILAMILVCAPAHASDIGTFSRYGNSSITSPVVNGTWNFDQSTGLIQVFGPGGWANAVPPISNYSSSRAPTTTDDSSAGWSTGAFWIDTTHNQVYVCLSAAVSSAVWHNITTATNTLTLTNKTLTSPILTSPVFSTIVNGGTLTLPTSTDTLVGRNTTDTLTNKSIDASEIASGVFGIGVGGTNNASLPVTPGGLLYTDGTRVQNSGAGSVNQVFISNGSSAPSTVSLTFGSAVLNTANFNKEAAISSSPTTLSGSSATTQFVTTGGSTFTLNLPAASTVAHKLFIIKKVDSGAGTIAVTPSGIDTIDGAGSFTVTNQYDFVAIQSDGSNWNSVGRYSASSGVGTVTSFSAGALSPLFTVGVATPTSTPALSFTLSNAAAGSLFANFGTSSGAPSYNAPGNQYQILGTVASSGLGWVYGLNGVAGLTSTTTLTNSSASYETVAPGSSNVTITLPLTTTCQAKVFVVEQISGSGTVTLQANGSDSIESSSLGASINLVSGIPIVLISDGVSAWRTIKTELVAGSNITLTPSGGQTTISSSAPMKYPPSAQSSNFTASGGSGTLYQVTCSSPVTATLPATPADGTVLRFTIASGSSTLTITAHSGESIMSGAQNSGAGGSLVIYSQASGVCELTAVSGGWIVSL